MKVVILTNADSIYCKEYVEHVLLGQYEVLIISDCNKKYRRYYKENGIKIITWQPPQTLGEIFADRIADIINSDDIFHVHYVDPRTLKYLWKTWMKCKKRILSYWGSDLLRLPPKQIRSLWPFVYTADEITVINNCMRRKMRDVVSKRAWNRIKCIDFGIPMYDTIEEVSKLMSVNECKQHFGLPDDKIVVAVGYNAIREQQHLEMMREVIKLQGGLLSEMFFVFHLGYGGKDSAYFGQLYKLLRENNVQYKVLECFLDKRETSILRLGTDILLYGQTTDAMSASVMECLYAGAVLIKPQWIDYSEVNGIDYYEYKQFDEISGILENLVKKGIKRMPQNKKPLREQQSWDVMAPKWKALYKEKTNGKRRGTVYMAKRKHR